MQFDSLLFLNGNENLQLWDIASTVSIIRIDHFNLYLSLPVFNSRFCKFWCNFCFHQLIWSLIKHCLITLCMFGLALSCWGPRLCNTLMLLRHNQLTRIGHYITHHFMELHSYFNDPTHSIYMIPLELYHYTITSFIIYVLASFKAYHGAHFITRHYLEIFETNTTIRLFLQCTHAVATITLRFCLHNIYTRTLNLA